MPAGIGSGLTKRRTKMTLYVLDNFITGDMAIFSTKKKREDFFRKWAHSLGEWPDESEYALLDIELDKEFTLDQW